ncbi:MAG: DNA polymerase III subunit beta [Bacteroidales bacterium]|jgi:DNA polymerase-3 subunit beta|nr:DNA polymerase III subunit beta [Bacteroidales bacterium]
MKFIVNGELLHKAMQSISGIISTNNAIPVVENFLLTLEDNSIVITGSDLETMASVKLELDSFEAGKVNQVLVPANMFDDLVGSFSSVPLSIIINDDTLAVEIKAGDEKYQIAGLPSENYPAMKEVNDPKTMSLSSAVIVDAIGKTAFAASNDELRPQMTGIFCEQLETGITFVATDAHKLVRYRRQDCKAEEEASFILPKKPLSLVSKILSSIREEIEVSIEYNFNNVSFTFSNYKIVSRLIEGKYPNYEAAIPKDNPNKLIIDRQLLLTSVKRAAILTNKSTQQVRLSLAQNKLVLSSEDMDYENKSEIPLNCSYEGENLEIGFNAKYLQDMLNNIDTTNVLIEMSQPNRAGIIYPYDENTENNGADILMLIMPVTLMN